MSQYTHRVPVSSLSIGPVISKSAFDLLNVFRTAPAAAPGPFVNKIEYTPQLIVRSSTGKAREGALESRE